MPEFLVDVASWAQAPARGPVAAQPRRALDFSLSATASTDSYGLVVETKWAEILLNTFPKIVFKARSLVFSNGMSANERAGFMYRFVELQRLHDWLLKLDREPSERTAIHAGVDRAVGR